MRSARFVEAANIYADHPDALQLRGMNLIYETTKSQNRQQDIDRKAAETDYQINIKAELEIEPLHQKLDELCETEICSYPSRAILACCVETFLSRARVDRRDGGV